MDQEEYIKKYARASRDLEKFWAQEAHDRLSWFKPWHTVLEGSFESQSWDWFQGGLLNMSFNCLDRHLPDHAQKTALIWEGNDGDVRSYTYAQLHQKVGQLSNVLKSYGLKRGDRVCLYLPMIPETLISMLACARLGLVHHVVFAGFSHEALKVRLLDSGSSFVITADEGYRAERRIPLKSILEKALEGLSAVKKVMVVRRGVDEVIWNPSRDVWFHESMLHADTLCPCEPMASNDPLFILYTSGSTGKPKGVVHTTAGYALYVAATFQDYFEIQPHDVVWCTADVGWITGHSYAVYGPLLSGVTTVMFEGVPHHPTYARCWEMVDRHQISIFYTAPTLLRSMRRAGDSWVKQASRSSLRLLGSVGEPLNPDVWQWYFNVVGAQRCPIINTWWQTETGGILLSALPHQGGSEPGDAGVPYYGITPVLVDESGMRLVGCNVTGMLMFERPWPGLMQTIAGDHRRLIENYLSTAPGLYDTGDMAYRDASGRLWVLGRRDDVIKVSGHRLGSGELESALVSHPAVSEAAVVGKPDELTGESVVAFVVLSAMHAVPSMLKSELIAHVRDKIGPIATLRHVYVVPDLPKTRSGKIIRRLLKKLILGEREDWGDVSMIANPDVMSLLVDVVQQEGVVESR